jgi:putative intracellular protease/amidase
MNTRTHFPPYRRRAGHRVNEARRAGRSAVEAGRIRRDALRAARRLVAGPSPEQAAAIVETVLYTLAGPQAFGLDDPSLSRRVRVEIEARFNEFRAD